MWAGVAEGVVTTLCISASFWFRSVWLDRVVAEGGEGLFGTTRTVR